MLAFLLDDTDVQNPRETFRLDGLAQNRTHEGRDGETAAILGIPRASRDSRCCTTSAAKFDVDVSLPQRTRLARIRPRLATDRSSNAARPENLARLARPENLARAPRDRGASVLRSAGPGHHAAAFAPPDRAGRSGDIAGRRRRNALLRRSL